MSVYYSQKRKKWRYHFTRKGIRYSGKWVDTKEEARVDEYKRKENLSNPPPPASTTPTDMAFLTLLNERLDHVKAYNSQAHYDHYKSAGKRWAKKWNGLMCSQISREMVQKFLLERAKVSHHSANHDLRYLRAAFNFGKEMGYIMVNPTERIKFLPVEKRLRHVPSPAEIDKVVAVADPETQDYLCVIRDTMARVSEINALKWQDVNLKERYVVLYTRKKRGGHLTPRKVPMTGRLFDILSRRYESREKGIPWVFWHRYYSRKQGRLVEGPFKDRGRMMRDLCDKAGVEYFRFHPLRHSGASIMENNLVPTTAIQKILGHENRTTTEIYLHSLGGMERAAIEKYEEAVGAEKCAHKVAHKKAQGVKLCA